MEVPRFGELMERPDLDLPQPPSSCNVAAAGCGIRVQLQGKPGEWGTEKSEQSRAITGLSPSMASYSKLLFVPLLDRSLPLQSVPKERDLVCLLFFPRSISVYPGKTEAPPLDKPGAGSALGRSGRLPELVTWQR